MTTRNVKTTELAGAALDWAVAMAVYPSSYVSGDRLRVRKIINGEEETIASVFLGKRKGAMREFSPSTDWSQGGPLIDRHGVTLSYFAYGNWISNVCEEKSLLHGETALIAAC